MKIFASSPSSEDVREKNRDRGPGHWIPFPLLLFMACVDGGEHEEQWIVGKTRKLILTFKFVCLQLSLLKLNVNFNAHFLYKC